VIGEIPQNVLMTMKFPHKTLLLCVQTKLSLCMPQRHTGCVQLQFHSFLAEVCGQLYTPATLS